MGHLLRVPLDDQGLLVLYDPFDRLPLFHLERLGEGSREYCFWSFELLLITCTFEM
jgi:hypothetical protein